MTFAKLFHKSNSSIHQLQGNVLECTIEQIHGTKVLVDTGMRSSFVCFRNELPDDLSPTSGFADLQSPMAGALRQLATSRSPVETMGRQVSEGRRAAYSLPRGKSSHGRVNEVEKQIPWRASVVSKGRQSDQLATGNWQLATGSCRPSGPTDSLRAWFLSHPNHRINHGENFWASLLAALWRRRIPSALHYNYFNRWGDSQRAPNRPSGREGCQGVQEEPRQPFNAPTCLIGLEEKRSAITGEFMCIAPKSLENISKHKLVWTELSNLWRISAKNRMKNDQGPKKNSRLLSGFILNSVNGGYAIAIAGYIAFLPKSLCINKRVFLGQWRQFDILSMNPKISNIVVEEIKTPFGVSRNKPSSRRGTARDRYKGPKTGGPTARYRTPMAVGPTVRRRPPIGPTRLADLS